MEANVGSADERLRVLRPTVVLYEPGTGTQSSMQDTFLKIIGRATGVVERHNVVNSQLGINKYDDSHSIDTYKKFIFNCSIPMTTELRNYIRSPQFDNWDWETAEVLTLMRQMFIDLGFIKTFHIDMDHLEEFLFDVYMHYNNVPFHNFKHCFMVTQMLYGFIFLIDLPRVLSDLDLFILIISCICHDLDHPGLNNTYQVNAKTEIAKRYKNVSPLENHHYAMGLLLVTQSSTDILTGLTSKQLCYFKEGMKSCILATDMSRHGEILKAFKAIPVDQFKPQHNKHIELLMNILIKAADISNEVRPLSVAMPWVDSLLCEFFNQADCEKVKGLPVAPFMDPEKVQKSTTQVNFIQFVILPLYESLAEVFPVIHDTILKAVRSSLAY